MTLHDSVPECYINIIAILQCSFCINLICCNATQIEKMVVEWIQQTFIDSSIPAHLWMIIARWCHGLGTVSKAKKTWPSSLVWSRWWVYPVSLLIVAWMPCWCQSKLDMTPHLDSSCCHVSKLRRPVMLARAVLDKKTKQSCSLCREV